VLTDSASWQPSVFQRELMARAPGSLVIDTRSTIDAAVVDHAVSVAAGMDTVLVALFSRPDDPSGALELSSMQRALVRRMSAVGKPVAAVAFGSPWLLGDFATMDALLCAYAPSDLMQRVAAAGLFGEFDLVGKLPVSIRGLAQVGRR